MNEQEGLTWEDVSVWTWLSLLAVTLLTICIIINVMTKPKGWIFWIILDVIIILVNVYATTRLIFTNHMIRIKRVKLQEKMKELEQMVKEAEMAEAKRTNLPRLISLLIALVGWVVVAVPIAFNTGGDPAPLILIGSGVTVVALGLFLFFSI